MTEREFKASATITINVHVEGSAEDKEDAIQKSKELIYSGLYESKDLENDPVINWVEFKDSEEDADTHVCDFETKGYVECNFPLSLKSENKGE